MISILDTLSLLWPFSRRSRATTIRCEAVDCSRINAEAADCSRVNAEAADCSRINAEAIGFGGVYIMQLENAQVFRTAPFKSGTAGPRLLLRFATDPENSGDTYGTPIVQADVASVTLTAYTATPNATTGVKTWAVLNDYNGITLTISEVISNTLRPWIGDELGYNFDYLVPADMFSGAADGDYGKVKIEVELDATGEVLTQVVEGKILF